MKILAIDPGRNGALASYDGTTLTTLKMPRCPRDAAVVVASWTALHDLVVIERVTGWFPGARMLRASQGFTMGAWFYGPMFAVLCSDWRKLRFVMAHQWQKDIGYKSAGYDSKNTGKAGLIDFARKLFPSDRIINQVADACLIAHWGFESRTKLLKKQVYKNSFAGKYSNISNTEQLKHNIEPPTTMAKKAAKKPAAKKAAAKKTPATKTPKNTEPQQEHYFLQRFGKTLAICIAETKITSDDENGHGTKAFKTNRNEAKDKMIGAQTFDELVEQSEADSDTVQKALNVYFESLRPGGRKNKADATE